MVHLKGPSSREKLAFFIIFIDSISSGVGGSKGKVWKKIHTPKKLKNREVF